MRPAVPLLLALLCASALAGCAGKAADSPPVGPPPSDPATKQESFQQAVFISAAPGCTQGVCAGGSYAQEVYTVPDGADLTALHLVLGHADNVDEAVSWKVWCESGVDGACERAFAKGHDKLPLTLDLAASAPAGAHVLVELTAPRMTPTAFADTVLSLTWGSSPLEGTATLAANATAVRPPLLAVNVSVDGHSGPCELLVEPNCTGYPGGTPFYFSASKLGGTVVGANLTMAWTASSPLDQELGLELYGSCGRTCPGPVDAEGPSPLRLVADGLTLDSDLRIEPYHLDPVFGRSLAGTRTPLHIEGVLWVQPEVA